MMRRREKSSLLFRKAARFLQVQFSRLHKAALRRLPKKRAASARKHAYPFRTALLGLIGILVCTVFGFVGYLLIPSGIPPAKPALLSEANLSDDIGLVSPLTAEEITIDLPEQTTAEPTKEPPPTATSEPSDTPTLLPTETITPTATALPTETPLPTATNITMPTATNTIPILPTTPPTLAPTEERTATVPPTAVPTSTSTPTLPPTAAPTNTSTPIPQPTAVPPTETPPPPTEPPSLSPSFNNCQADPNANSAPNAPIRIAAIDKRAETVTLTNVSGAAVNLDGWIMCSIKGNQRHDGVGGVLEPGQSRTFEYTGGNIWNNSDKDDGALYNPNGSLVSYWHD